MWKNGKERIRRQEGGRRSDRQRSMKEKIGSLQIVKKYRNLGLARRMLVWMLALSLLPILIIILISYSLNSGVMNQQTGRLVQANLEQSASSVENFWNTYDRLIQGIYTDTTYMTLLKPINRWDSSEYQESMHQLEIELEHLIYSNPEILGIAILGSHYDCCFYDSITKSGQESIFFNETEFRSRGLLELVRQKQETIYSGTIHCSAPGYDGYDCLYMLHQLVDFDSYQDGLAGCIILCVDEAALRQVYQDTVTESSLTFVVNRAGEVISHPLENRTYPTIVETDGEENLTEEQLSQGALEYVEQVGYFPGGELQVSSRQVLNGQFYVVNVYDRMDGLSEFRQIAGIILCIGLIAALLCIFFAIQYSSDVDKSVQPILKAMDEADAAEASSIREEGDDEFTRISRHFNRMMQRLTHSRQQEKEAMIREKNAEIKSLEAQINPHFLYNTLDTINWMALNREEYAISKMLTSLAAILRYSIHRSNTIVEISEELEYLKKYIYLQQQRFDYSFLCTVEADEEVRSCRIHKMLIQPFLENTLVHGFPGDSEMDEVNVRLWKDTGERIRIEIRDNGRGMSPEQVEYFNHFDYRSSSVEESIGVRNVITRLKLYYGEQGEFHMESGTAGTVVTLWIPCGQEQESEE